MTPEAVGVQVTSVRTKGELSNGRKIHVQYLPVRLMVSFVKASFTSVQGFCHSGGTSYIRGVVCSWRKLCFLMTELEVQAHGVGDD